MVKFISMLRGINVSGQKKVRMDELRRAYEALDFTHVETYVQSGNVVFGGEEIEAVILANRIEAHLEQTFGFTTPVFIRRTGDFLHVLSHNPFLTGRNEDPARLHVTFLYSLPAEIQVGDIKNPNKDGDEFLIQGQEIYLFCPNGYGKTKLNNNFFERRSGMPATTRNWNTVRALYDMAIGR